MLDANVISCYGCIIPLEGKNIYDDDIKFAYAAAVHPACRMSKSANPTSEQIRQAMENSGCELVRMGHSGHSKVIIGAVGSIVTVQIMRELEEEFVKMIPDVDMKTLNIWRSDIQSFVRSLGFPVSEPGRVVGAYLSY